MLSFLLELVEFSSPMIVEISHVCLSLNWGLATMSSRNIKTISKPHAVKSLYSWANWAYNGDKKSQLYERSI